MVDEDEIRGLTLMAGEDEVGTVEAVFIHPAEDRPPLVAVGSNAGSLLVPLHGAQIEDDQVTVDYDAGTIAGAPTADSDELSDADFTAVYDHYGISEADFGTPGLGG